MVYVAAHQNDKYTRITSYTLDIYIHNTFGLPYILYMNLAISLHYHTFTIIPGPKHTRKERNTRPSIFMNLNKIITISLTELSVNCTYMN